MSKLVRFISRLYGAALAGTIAVAAVYPAAAPAAGERTLLCALVPHFKDEYWLSVGYGLEQEAARQNVDLLFFEAGGYLARAAQVEQLDVCLARGVDAILIGAVTSDHPDLIDKVAQVAGQVPIFGLVNELHSDALSGHIGVDWRDMGRRLGDHLSGLHPAGSPPKTAIFLTGPAISGWTDPLEAGLRNGLSAGTVEIIEVFEADTGFRAQLDLVETALQRHPGADYLIGSAPAIEAALGLLAARPASVTPGLLASYVNHSVLRGLENGRVLAASFDSPIEQGVMAVREATAAHLPSTSGRWTGPDIILLTGESQGFDERRLSPAAYFPVLQ
ncbi:MAG TPA: TMAO reductase system periplasmic protein TorT [Roseovarius sp.]